jgi:rod shape-determining protein MreD
MTNIIIRNSARFILLILLQVLVFNHIEIDSYLIPHIYVMFILLLPFETPKWLVLLSAFLLGLFIDMFSYTIGLHTAACVLMGFLRPIVQNIVSSRQENEAGVQPGISGLGFKWFLAYTVILVGAHHLLIYFLDEFRFINMLNVIFRALLNTGLTTISIVIAQLLFFRPKS